VTFIPDQTARTTLAYFAHLNNDVGRTVCRDHYAHHDWVIKRTNPEEAIDDNLVVVSRKLPQRRFVQCFQIPRIPFHREGIAKPISIESIFWKIGLLERSWRRAEQKKAQDDCGGTHEDNLLASSNGCK